MHNKLMFLYEVKEPIPAALLGGPMLGYGITPRPHPPPLNTILFNITQLRNWNHDNTLVYFPKHISGKFKLNKND